MLKLLQKLSEIDAPSGKQSTLLENAMPVEECGDMSPVSGTSPTPHTPASINITASTGPELSGMLKDLMSLAGIHPVTQDHMPTIKITDIEPEEKPTGNLDMRKMLDSMNYSEEEQDEDYTNTPDDPTDVPDFEADKFAYDPNTGDHRERQAGLSRAVPVEESTVEGIQSKLFLEYKKFIEQ